MLSTLNPHIQMLKHHTEAGTRQGRFSHCSSFPGEGGQCELNQSTPPCLSVPSKTQQLCTQLALRLMPDQYPAPSQHFWDSWVNMEYISTWEALQSRSSEPEQKGDLCNGVCSWGGTQQEAGNRFFLWHPVKQIWLILLILVAVVSGRRC